MPSTSPTPPTASVTYAALSSCQAAPCSTCGLTCSDSVGLPGGCSRSLYLCWLHSRWSKRETTFTGASEVTNLVVSAPQGWVCSHMMPSAGCRRSLWSEYHFPVLSSRNKPTYLMGKGPWADKHCAAGSTLDGSQEFRSLI